MNYKFYNLIVMVFFPVMISCFTGCSPDKDKNKTSDKTAKEVIDIIYKVNSYWQTNNPEHGDAFWHRAAYHTGNMAAYEVAGNETYKAYSEAWAEHNEWKGAKSDIKENW